jgi:nitrous oxidase accessory protein NosD
MIRLYFMLNNRKRFVISAAMGALLVLLACGANALAGVRVTARCVPNLSVNPTCTDSYSTIQKAVNAAHFGDAIFVGPGTYNESVTINVQALALLGVQAGNDARFDRYDPSKESIVDASSKGSSAFIVTAGGVVIDGFTIQGGTSSTAPGAPSPPAGVYVANGNPLVRNNILQNNSTGVYILGGWADVIKQNLFRTNNAGKAPNYGYGIVLNTGWLAIITENEFAGNKTAAIDVNSAGAVTITDNTSENDGSFAIFTGVAQSVFSHNQGKNFGHTGVLSGAQYGDAAVAVGFGNNPLVISDNDLENGEGPISNGIAFTPAFGTTCGSPSGPCPSQSVSVTNNKIQGFPENGIVAEQKAGTGMLEFSWIHGNEVLDNGVDGILIEVNNHNNSIMDNVAEGNQVFDCADDTATPGGGGTLGTEESWFNNAGNSSNLTGPPPLCTPGSRHDHY